MKRLALMEKILREQFRAHYFELQNESHKHSVPEGSETHFKLLVVDERFTGLSRVQAQRMIQGLFAEEFKMGLHALSLRCISIEEWAKSGGDFASPPCHSKS